MKRNYIETEPTRSASRLEGLQLFRIASRRVASHESSSRLLMLQPLVAIRRVVDARRVSGTMVALHAHCPERRQHCECSQGSGRGDSDRMVVSVVSRISRLVIHGKISGGHLSGNGAIRSTPLTEGQKVTFWTPPRNGLTL